MFFDYSAFDYYIKPGIVDMRCGIDRLVKVVQRQMLLDPFKEDSMFLFCGRTKKNLKVLVCDQNGFWLMQKKLLIGTYAWPIDEEEALKLTKDDVVQLLYGADIFRKLPDLGNDLII